MSLLGQLQPQYGNKDTIGVMRDIDLVLGIAYDKPEFQKAFRSIRDRVAGILSLHPDKAANLRNDIFRAKNTIIKKYGSNISGEDSGELSGIDRAHFEYQRLMVFRQIFLSNPHATLKAMTAEILSILHKYPLPFSGLKSISAMVSEAGSAVFERDIHIVSLQYGHIGAISYCEGLISAGKSLKEVCKYAKKEREKYEGQKQDSMKYWDFTNIINLAETRMKIAENHEGGESRSFVLSGGAGNGFSQLGVIYEFVKNGGKIKSISGTSMGATIAIMVGKIGNDHEKIHELMQDLIEANMNGSIPEKLKGNEEKMLDVLHTLRAKYGITDDLVFKDLRIPVLVNAGRQYPGGEQEVILGGSERVIPSILASMNVPFPHKNNNTGVLKNTPVHGVNMIDYAANERGNPTHWLEVLGIEQKDIIDIDVGYSSEKGGSPTVRRLFQRATIRDFFAKLRIRENGGKVIDMPLDSSEGYYFPPGALERFFSLGSAAYNEIFSVQSGQ